MNESNEQYVDDSLKKALRVGDKINFQDAIGTVIRVGKLFITIQLIGKSKATKVGTVVTIGGMKYKLVSAGKTFLLKKEEEE